MTESFTQGAWHCFCLGFGCNNPTYLPQVLTVLSCLWVWHPHLLPQLSDWFFVLFFCAYFLVLIFYIFLYIYFFFFIYFFVFVLLLFLLISFLGKLILLTTSRILHPCPLLSSRFAVCFSSFNGGKLSLMTLVDLYWGDRAYFQSNCQSGRRDWKCSCS